MKFIIVIIIHQPQAIFSMFLWHVILTYTRLHLTALSTFCTWVTYLSLARLLISFTLITGHRKKADTKGSSNPTTWWHRTVSQCTYINTYLQCISRIHQEQSEYTSNQWLKKGWEALVYKIRVFLFYSTTYTINQKLFTWYCICLLWGVL